MVGEVLCFFLVSLVRFEKRVVMLQRRHHDVYTVERATKEKAKSDFFGGELTAVRSKVTKPEEEAINERNEDFVSLADVLDAEHDPQLTMLPMMECGEEKEEEHEIKKGSQQSKKEEMPWGLLVIYIDVDYVSIFIYVDVSIIDVVCVVVYIFAVVYIDVSVVVDIAHSKLKSFL
ncbi:unnamed protein product [Brassica napus]|uniref:(rape) hypothetical protein n=1 Tax=Brassica napus TaxID=3708 RepID=A0A816PPK2_BRANA|nr:unnamed protein product [Brassica napus]